MNAKPFHAFEHFEEGILDVQFNKSGLERINVIASHWDYDPFNRVLRHKHNGDTIQINTLCKFKIGMPLAVLDSNIDVEICSIELMTLDKVTDELALRAGIEKQTDGNYKHYCPELFFPKKLLKTQPKGSPAYKNPKGSFFSLWALSYGYFDIYRNPWIWCYTFKTKK
jgi:hypothetical protein